MNRLTSELQEEALQLFLDLLRIDTSNPPGNERPAAERCAEELRKDGFEPQLLEGKEDRTNLVCRWQGTGEEAPLLLTAHLDVVPATGDWTHPPFGGEIHDGYIWGRGAVDMKHHAAMTVTVMRALARSKTRLRRDVILALVADEETDCTWGSAWLVKNHPDLVRAEYALGEIGGFTLHADGHRFYPIQIAQKGILWLEAKAKGKAGHGSMPLEESAIGELSAAIARVAAVPLPVHTPDATRAFIEGLASTLGGVKGAVLRGLLIPALAPTILRSLPDRGLARSLRAVLSNTASPTILRAGDKINVIPGEARAHIDGRSLPGSAGTKLMAELQQVAGPNVELEVMRQVEGIEFSHETPLFEALSAAVRRADPEGIPIPYMIPGFTDGYAFSQLGTIYYGFAPMSLPPGLPFAELFHNVDERIPVEGFRFGLRLLFDAVQSFCAAPAERSN